MNSPRWWSFESRELRTSGSSAASIATSVQRRRASVSAVIHWTRMLSWRPQLTFTMAPTDAFFTVAASNPRWRGIYLPSGGTVASGIHAQQVLSSKNIRQTTLPSAGEGPGGSIHGLDCSAHLFIDFCFCHVLPDQAPRNPDKRTPANLQQAFS